MKKRGKKSHQAQQDQRLAETADARQQTAEGVSAEQEKPTMQQLTEERDQLYQRLQREMADFQNYQKRTARERQELIERTEASTLQNLLPVLDDLDRAIEAAQNDTNHDDPVLSGIMMVRQRMLGLLKALGVEPIESVGEPFDPLYHEAIMQQPTDEYPVGAVLQEIQRGYMFKDRTLRPAKVIVARALEERQAAVSGEHENDAADENSQQQD